MKPNRKKPTIKVRNWQAVNAHFRKAGSMKDHKKEASRKECRGFKGDVSRIRLSDFD